MASRQSKWDDDVMRQTSTLTLAWASRNIGDNQRPRRFLEFVVDGTPLAAIFWDRDDARSDWIGRLGWSLPDYESMLIEQLLLRAPVELPDQRQALLVCAECGDLGCGAVTAVIERVGDHIIWRDFGFQNNYEPGRIEGCDYSHVGPIVFDAAAYERALRDRPLSEG